MQTDQNVVDYYTHLTKSYLTYAPDTYGWHYGIWEPGIKTHFEALLQSNKVLLRGLNITPETRILDVGCGVGGFTVWAAAEFGCRVTGITVVPLHVVLAYQLAAKRGLSELCDFALMDMTAMTFPDSSFDIIVNQETMCYAIDKGQYLKDVNRILKPGGIWRSIEFSVQDEPLSKRDQKEYRTVCDTFFIPSLVSASEVRSFLQEADYAQFETQDLTPLVGRTARGIIRGTYVHSLALRLGLDWLLVSRDPDRRGYYRGHVRGGVAYSRGLLGGCFRHNYYSARKRTSLLP